MLSLLYFLNFYSKIIFRYPLALFKLPSYLNIHVNVKWDIPSYNITDFKSIEIFSLLKTKITLYYQYDRNFKNYAYLFFSDKPVKVILQN